MPASIQTSAAQPRPQQAGFKPATKEEMRGDLLLAGICLLGFLLGLGANLFGNLSGFLDMTARTVNNEPTSLWLQLFVFYAYPLFLIAAGYYAWHAIDRRRKTAHFLRHCVRGEAVITHLWKEPPSGSGKKYYIGYQTSTGANRYVETDVYTFKRFQIGDRLPVDYLSTDPDISCPVLKPVKPVK